MDTFAKKLREERIYNHLTQKQMAQKLGITLRGYQNYEARGVNSREPDLVTLVKIAAILDVTTDYLLGLRDF